MILQCIELRLNCTIGILVIVSKSNDKKSTIGVFRGSIGGKSNLVSECFSCNGIIGSNCYPEIIISGISDCLFNKALCIRGIRSLKEDTSFFIINRARSFTTFNASESISKNTRNLEIRCRAQIIYKRNCDVFNIMRLFKIVAAFFLDLSRFVEVKSLVSNFIDILPKSTICSESVCAECNA